MGSRYRISGRTLSRKVWCARFLFLYTYSRLLLLTQWERLLEFSVSSCWNTHAPLERSMRSRIPFFMKFKFTKLTTQGKPTTSLHKMREIPTADRWQFNQIEINHFIAFSRWFSVLFPHHYDLMLQSLFLLLYGIKKFEPSRGIRKTTNEKILFVPQNLFNAIAILQRRSRLFFLTYDYMMTSKLPDVRETERDKESSCLCKRRKSIDHNECNEIWMIKNDRWKLFFIYEKCSIFFRIKWNTSLWDSLYKIWFRN